MNEYSFADEARMREANDTIARLKHRIALRYDCGANKKPQPLFPTTPCGRCLRCRLEAEKHLRKEAERLRKEEQGYDELRRLASKAQQRYERLVRRIEMHYDCDTWCGHCLRCQLEDEKQRREGAEAELERLRQELSAILEGLKTSVHPGQPWPKRIEELLAAPPEERGELPQEL